MLRNLRTFQDVNVHGSLLYNISRRLQGVTPCAYQQAQSNVDLSKNKVKKKENVDYTKRRQVLALQIKDCLNFSEDEAVKLIEKNKTLWRVPSLIISRNIEFLLDKKVTTKTIFENPWLMGLPLSKLMIPHV